MTKDRKKTRRKREQKKENKPNKEEQTRRRRREEEEEKKRRRRPKWRTRLRERQETDRQVHLLWLLHRHSSLRYRQWTLSLPLLLFHPHIPPYSFPHPCPVLSCPSFNPFVLFSFPLLFLPFYILYTQSWQIYTADPF